MPRTRPGFPRPCVKHKSVVLSLGTFEKVKLYKARHLVEMTIARKPDLFESCFGPFGNSEAVHRDRRNVSHARGAIVLRQKWSRGQVEARLANIPPCLIGMEACVGAHHLSKLASLGHDAG